MPGTTDEDSPYRYVAVVMGVSGTGKTTVGQRLATALGVPYAEADDFHPRANVVKMAAGAALDDADRAPWLDAIGGWARERAGRGGVVSCSALKRRYRDRLRAAASGLVFVHLVGDYALIAERMRRRTGHFMSSGMLRSQFDTLEPLQSDEVGFTVDVHPEPATVAQHAVTGLRQSAPRASDDPGPRP